MFESLTHFGALDWAKDHHDVVILEPSGRIVADFCLPHTAAGWKLWREKIAAYPKLAVALETSFGAAAEQLMDSGVTVYPIHPKRSKAYRQRQCSSDNKTDHLDAWAMADALRMDGHAWRPLEPTDPIIAQLRVLCRDEVALIEERTALVNQLQQALLEYYPTALEAFEDWTLESAWAFVQRFPTTQALLKAGKRQWEKFLHSHGLYRPQTYQKRLDIFAKAGEWKLSEPLVAAKSLYAVVRCRQLSLLQTQLQEYRKSIEALFASHPDSALFGSLPGAGPKLAPRLLSEIGSQRSLYEDAQALQCLAGTAPISYQSGKLRKVIMRHSCNKNLRHAMHLFANLSRATCSWAQIYYEGLKQRGKTHVEALRSLGQRWLKIIWKMWQTRTAYDGELHLKNQLAHGSWVLQVVAQ